MKFFLLFFAIFLSANDIKAQSATSPPVINDTLKNVEAACGQCKFGMKEKGCNLAIRFNGRAYFVDGTKIDDHGDAHADDGFCNKIRKADVTGFILKGRFVATGFKLLEEEKTTQQQ
jgi:hypothetical protein